MVLAAASWMNLPNRVPVFAKPHEGSSIRRLSSAFQTTSACLLFIVTSTFACDQVALLLKILQTVSRLRTSSNDGAGNFSAHCATAEAATPVASFQLPCEAAIWIARLPNVVDSVDPRITSSPVRSAVRRFNREFLLPPPTMRSRFRFLPVIAAINQTKSPFPFPLV